MHAPKQVQKWSTAKYWKSITSKELTISWEALTELWVVCVCTKWRDLAYDTNWTNPHAWDLHIHTNYQRHALILYKLRLTQF